MPQLGCGLHRESSSSLCPVNRVSWSVFPCSARSSLICGPSILHEFAVVLHVVFFVRCRVRPLSGVLVGLCVCVCVFTVDFLSGHAGAGHR